MDDFPPAMNHEAVDTAIRSRRTVKEFLPEPVPDEVLHELFEIARWAPNHRLTEPWRFRVVGHAALTQLKAAAGTGADKLDRAPTLVVVTAVQTGAPLQDEEDVLATGCALYAVMLAATARGYGSYWRTPGVLRSADGRSAVGVPDNEHIVGLLHLGRVSGDHEAPPRASVEHFTTWLD